MRVISNYKDFYDSAGFIDTSIIFVRKQTEIEVDIPHPMSYSGITGVGVLGFCGKFYPYIHRAYEAVVNEKTGVVIPEQHFYFYSVDEYIKSKFWDSETRFSWRRRNLEQGYREFFAHWKDSDNLFIQADAPYFRVKGFSYRNSKGMLKTNPNLLSMQFGKIMDAPSVFQAVQFYLTNQLVKTKDPDEIEDKYRLAQHGFDKHSFRHPTKLKDLK